MSTTRPPFIADQGWRILCEFDDPWEYLKTEYFRAGRPGMGGAAESDPGHWQVVTPEQLVAGKVSVDGRAVDVRLTAVTTDAGIGKTKALERLLYLFNLPGSHQLAFRIDSWLWDGDDSVRDTAGLLERMASEIQSRTTDDGCTLQQAQRIVNARLAAGRLTLLVDGLDQFADTAVLARLTNLIGSPHLPGCRWVVAGRPYALNAARSQLFKTLDWKFVQVDEFDEDQQRRFLGKMGNGKVRFDELPDDARPILSVPRVLEYIREISDDKLAAIRTPADVYYLSICRLLARALEDGSETARKLGCSRGASSTKPQDEQILRGLALLGAIAWEMTCTPAFETGDVPNFFLIPRSQLLNFKDLQVAPRYRVATGGSLTQDWTALGALNTILEHGFFDGSSAGLSEIQFRDRTLQEFCCAWYLAQHAFDPAELTAAADNLERQQTILRRQAADRDRLRKWMHLPEYVETEAYYGIWQFLCDMPGPRDAVQDETWLAAIEPLYQKSVANADGMRQVKRSSEMIFRSWSRLDRMCRGSHPYPRALQLRDDWLGEFDEILEGGQGPERMAAARELTESFLSIPAGEFQMGSPPEHQVLGGEMKSQYENWLKGRPPDPSQWNAYITDTFKENPPKSRAEKHWNLRFRTVLLKMLQSNSLISLEDYWQIRNETPEAEIQTVADFQLSRTPVLNAWYRLYTPEHGKAPAWFADDYSKYSATPRQPAIFVSFFDAWAFAMWAQWNGNQCRLPWENEWEYAAKFRRPGDWKYWWCRDYDKKSFDKRCNGNMNHGQTSEPITKHANPCTRKIDMARKGLMDMLGNVCEWCQDRCRVKYERTEEDDTPCDAGSPRTQRGGGWIYFLRGCRAALRVGNLPGFRSLDGGFRLARNSVEAGSRVD